MHKMAKKGMLHNGEKERAKNKLYSGIYGRGNGADYTGVCGCLPDDKRGKTAMPPSGRKDCRGGSEKENGKESGNCIAVSGKSVGQAYGCGYNACEAMRKRRRMWTRLLNLV